jgi:hypothetical protein
MADVRSKLASALDDVSEADVRALVDDVLKATTDQWVPVTCKGCGKTAKYSVTLPDTRARTQALQILVDQGLGKATTAERDVTFSDGSKSKIVNSREEFEALSSVELRAIADGKLEADWATRLSTFSSDELVELEAELPAERERRALLDADVAAASGPRIFRPKTYD